MKSNNIMSAYGEIFFYSMYFIIMVLAIALFAILIVSPLWFAASNYKDIYTFSFFSIFIIWLVSRSAVKIKKDKKYISRMVSVFFKIIVFLIITLFLYSSILLFSNQLYLHSAILLMIIIAFTGFIKIIFMKKNA